MQLQERGRMKVPLFIRSVNNEGLQAEFTVRREDYPHLWDPEQGGQLSDEWDSIVYEVSITGPSQNNAHMSRQEYPERSDVVKLNKSYNLTFRNNRTGMRELRGGIGPLVLGNVLKSIEIFLRKVQINCLTFCTAHPRLTAMYYMTSKTIEEQGLGRVPEKFFFANKKNSQRDASRGSSSSFYLITQKLWERYQTYLNSKNQQENQIVDKKDALQEAKFASGDALKVVEKMLNVLGRRLGTEFMLSDIPRTYQTSEGKFAGYMAFFDGGDKALRVNFLLGKSDEVISVDYFAGPSEAPDVNLALNGLNIVQTIADIELMVRGEDIWEAVSLDERQRVNNVVMNFMQTGNVMSDLQSGRYSGWQEVLDDYTQYCQDVNEQPKNRTTLMRNIQKHFEAEGLSLNVTAATRRRPRQEQPITPPEERPDVERFQTEIIENEHLVVYDILDATLEQMGAGDPMVNGLILYGQAGIGKSFTIKKKFKAMGLAPDRDFFVYTGSVAGKTGILQLLWRHARDTILILDDMDQFITNKDSQNFLKAALQSDAEDRWISYIKKESAGPSTISVDDSGNMLFELDEADYAHVQDMRALKEEEIDFTSDDGVEYGDGAFMNVGAPPEKFQFLSKIIIVSNMMNFPEALLSRCAEIKIDMTVEQTLEYMRTILGDLLGQYPEVSLEYKVKVWEFLVEKSGSIRQMDFRKFRDAVSTARAWERKGKTLDDPGWKVWAMLKLR